MRKEKEGKEREEEGESCIKGGRGKENEMEKSRSGLLSVHSHLN